MLMSRQAYHARNTMHHDAMLKFACCCASIWWLQEKGFVPIDVGVSEAKLGLCYDVILGKLTDTSEGRSIRPTGHRMMCICYLLFRLQACSRTLDFAFADAACAAAASRLGKTQEAECCGATPCVAHSSAMSQLCVLHLPSGCEAKDLKKRSQQAASRAAFEGVVCIWDTGC